VVNKEAEKFLKYKDPQQKYSACGVLKAKVIPVIRGKTGTITKSFRKYLTNMTGKHEIKNYRKQPYLHTCFGKY
jgi:hypothetical protein